MALPRIRVHERQVLMLLLGVAVLGYGAAIIGNMMVRAKEQKLSAVSSARVRWMRPTNRSGDRYLLADYFDPSLMSLPSSHGYSAAAWLLLAPPVYQAFEPVRPPAFLPAPTGQAVPVLLEQGTLGDVVSAGLERTSVPAGDDESTVALPPIARVTNSVLEVTGKLANRRILRKPVLPLAPAELAMRRARVLIAANQDGQVQYAVLDRSTQSEALDQQAVELARQIVFEPVAGVDPLALTWGTARFLWAPAEK